MKPATRWIAALAAALLLLGVGNMYTQPDFLVQMANQVWSCF